MTRVAILTVALVLAGSCFAAGWYSRPLATGASPADDLHGSDRNRPARRTVRGWEYQRNRYRNVVRYHFGDSADSEFVGLCDSQPVFALFGGDYPFGVTHFQLVIDGTRWTLPAFQGVEGRGLFVSDQDPRFNDRLANARDIISFRIGHWARTLRAGPEIAWFVQQCRAMRRRDPGAVGVGSEF